MIICSSCKEAEVPDSLRDCPGCGHDNGPPNVRKANSTEELGALEQRFQDAVTSCTARGVLDKMEAFSDAVSFSKAVIARPLSEILQLIEDDKHLYVSFARKVQAGLRSPADKGYDPFRSQFENAAFPNYSPDILFGSLSLNGEGLRGYGGGTMVLKDSMIRHRATVFDENPAVLGKKLGLTLNDVFPPGYRAAWDYRQKLAVAKLHPLIKSDTKTSDFAAILQSDKGGTGNSDFIEVHVYGTINNRSIERLSASGSLLREDRPIWRSLQNKARKLGIEA